MLYLIRFVDFGIMKKGYEFGVMVVKYIYKKGKFSNIIKKIIK